MKTLKKPLAAMIAALVLSGLFSFLTPSAHAAGAPYYVREGDWKYYPNESGGMTAFGYYGKETNVIIPATTEEGLTVTEIDSAFNYNKTVKSVTVPASVLEIHAESFAYCQNLKTVKFASGSKLKLIGVDAFSVCSKLVNFEIPKTVTQIHDGAFRKCKKLKTITIPSGVTSIGIETFSECTSLETVTLSNNITRIGIAAFENCKSIKSIKLPTKLKSIGSSKGGIGVFEGCSSLESIKIPANVKTMTGNSFGNCRSLKKITVDSKNKYFTAQNGVLFNKNMTKLILYPPAKTTKAYTVPKTVKTIGTESFLFCKNLTSVKLQTGVKTIEGSAFQDCKNMTKLTIPSSVTTIKTESLNYISDKCVLQVKANSKAHQYAKTWGLKYKLI